MAVRVSDVVGLCAGLGAAEVRYLVVGGLAVIAHGHVRTTVDIDLVLDPEPANLRMAVAVFRDLGYQPRVPVDLMDFVSADNRRRWRDTKDMLVFTLIKGNGGGSSEVDLFLEAPFDFPAAYADAFWQDLPDGGRIPFVDLARLLKMKEGAGRDKDLADLAVLRKLHDDG